MTSPGDVARRLARLHERIADAGGDPDAVRVVAVTKGFGPEVVTAALAVGVVDVGESYAQELRAKAEALTSAPREAAPRWHFVGRLQTNKVARLASLVEVWQSVDRVSLVRQVSAHTTSARMLVQVNVSGEPSKGGC
ncbi:MAG: YggS family pyridoxal phosphate-dependent enzyme, partial [Actinomycetota bacterium]|nr:YggS family pyridoxal phosphate-dependent enzyme [Actinomycetota bacterium]